MNANLGTYIQSQIARPESSGLSGKMLTENHPEYSGPDS